MSFNSSQQFDFTKKNVIRLPEHMLWAKTRPKHKIDLIFHSLPSLEDIFQSKSIYIFFRQNNRSVAVHSIMDDGRFLRDHQTVHVEAYRGTKIPFRNSPSRCDAEFIIARSTYWENVKCVKQLKKVPIWFPKGRNVNLKKKELFFLNGGAIPKQPA